MGDHSVIYTLCWSDIWVLTDSGNLITVVKFMDGMGITLFANMVDRGIVQLSGVYLWMVFE